MASCAHSASCVLYELILNMPEHRLALIAVFANAVSEASQFNGFLAHAEWRDY